MVNSALIFIASIAGIFAYFIEKSVVIFATFSFLFCAGVLVTLVAHYNTKQYPVMATWLFLAWRIVPLTFVFLGAYTSAWLSLNILHILPIAFSTDPGAADTVKANQDTLKSLTTTAITTLLAALVLDAARDPASSFWPAERQKRALKAAFHDSPVFKLSGAGMTQEVRHAIEDLAAAYIEPSTTDNKATGWTFKDRLHRAEIIQNSIHTLKRNHIEV